MARRMTTERQSTTIRVPSSVRAALDRYRKPGQTYAEVLEDLLRELDRQYRRERREQMRQWLRESGIEITLRNASRSTATLRR